MSYCRWSPDSDFYVWHDWTDTWRVEVAGRVFHDPKWAAQQGRSGRTHTQCFCGTGQAFDTPGEAADWIEELVGYGYVVPDGTVEALREDEQ